MAKTILLPDFQGKWKWPRQINPYTEEIRQESSDWAASFGAFTPRAQEAFDKCNFNLLTGLLYPWFTKDQLRCANDLMNLFFIFDEHSDKSGPDDVWSQVSAIMDALHNPLKPRPEGEWVGGEVARQFWARTCAISTSTFQKRFIDAMEEYLQGTAQQAEDRHASHIRDIDSYLQVRRKTIGVLSSFNMLEMDMNLPDEVMQHSIIQEIEALGVELTIIANDVLSYNKEQASGDDQHNLITIAMREKAMDVQQTIDWAARLHADMTKRFNKLFLEIPRWGGPLDWEVQTFVNGVAHWVGANVQWSYESGRYFGDRGLEVRATRVLHLSPKRCLTSEVGPVVLDETVMG